MREVETVVLIAWEGFFVHVWATDEHDLCGRRVWYCRADGLSYSRVTSRDQAVRCGAERLRKEILAANRAHEPHSREFLDSLEDPYVEEVFTIICVTREDLAVRIVASQDMVHLGGPRRWRFKTGPDMRGVIDRRVAIARAKQYLRALDRDNPRCALCGYRHSMRERCDPPF